jgi:TonB family protein
MERLLLRAAIVLAVLGAMACAGRRPASTGFDEPPRLVWSPPLAYPESLLLARVEGTVVVEARVDADGTVDCGSVRVRRSTHRAFEAPAIRMVCAARFRPAQVGGAPTVAVVDLPIRFQVEGGGREVRAAAEAAAEAERLAAVGRIPQAMEAFWRAQRLDGRVASQPALLLTLCWHGGVWGYAEQVIDVCDRLVALDPGDVRARDARGIARTLTGEYQGAIADFEQVRAHSPDDLQRAEREEWIEALRAGRNPLTLEVLERLRIRVP